MKTALLRLLLSFCLIQSSFAQGTAFTYQGRLNDGATPASGGYDLRFAIFDAAVGGAQQGGLLTNSATVVSNGLFTVTLDFGNQFPGADRWLEISVRTNGAANFDLLSPRQPLAAAPYAIQAATAASAASVAAANISGTVQYSQLPSNVAVNGGNIVGVFYGNGAGLTGVPGAYTPQVVAGTNINATANTAYDLTNSALTTVTLPASANIGDVVQVNGLGAGGWRVSMKQVWKAHPIFKEWRGTASSADGSKLVAVPYGGQIFTSTDRGESWVARGSSRAWIAVASSADGDKLVAAEYGGQIYTSTNGGVTWTARESGRAWMALASSADGNNLVAVVSGGRIYTSTDAGNTWTPRENNRNWRAVASSSDGSRLVAAESSGYIYTSTNGGVTWAQQTTIGYWQAIASSADGSRLVALENGAVYTSIDGGVTWTWHLYLYAPGNASVASSADGRVLIASGYFGSLHNSVDAGATWQQQSGNLYQPFVATSADGKTFLAAESSGQIYTSILPAVFNGDQGTMQRFQYVGGGVWQPMTWAGSSYGGALNVTPTPLNLASVTGGANGVIQGDHYAGIAAGTNGFVIYDVAAPGAPAFVARANQGLNNQGIGGGDGGMLYLGCGLDGLAVINVTNALAPFRIALTNDGGFYQTPVVANGYAYVPTSLKPLIYAVTNPAAPVFLGSLENSPAGLAVSGNTLYYAGQNSLRIYTLTNPAVPALIGSNAVPQAQKVMVDGTRAFVICGNPGTQISIFDVSSPTTILPLGTISNTGSFSFTKVAVSGARAYVANSGEGVHVYDLSNLASPATVRVLSGGLFPTDITVSGPYAYVSESGGGTALRIYGIGDVANFVAGSTSNSVAAGVVGAAIGGGGAQSYLLSVNGQSQSVGGPNVVNADFGTISGGLNNSIAASSLGAAIAGGVLNRIGSNSLVAAIGGGYNNSIGDYSLNAVIAGGDGNSIGSRSDTAAILGGSKNVISNNASASAIGGGNQNQIGLNALNATVPGGYRNYAGGNYSLAAGYQARANHQGAFVWSDSQGPEFSSSANNQFLIRAGGGVGIGTSNPSQQLHVIGNILASGTILGTFSGNGGGLTSLNAANLVGSVPQAALTSIPAGNLIGSVPAAGLTAVPAENLTGTVSSDRLPPGVVFNNASGVALAGTFSGNGSALTSVPATNLTGLVPQAGLGATNAFVPTMGNGSANFTTSITSGYYAKVGNLVYFEVWLQWTSKNSVASGNLAISLPPVPVVSQRPVFNLGFVSGITSSSPPVPLGTVGSSAINLYVLSAAGGSATIVPVSSCSASGEIQITGWYRWQ